MSTKMSQIEKVKIDIFLAHILLMYIHLLTYHIFCAHIAKGFNLNNRNVQVFKPLHFI